MDSISSGLTYVNSPADASPSDNNNAKKSDSSTTLPAEVANKMQIQRASEQEQTADIKLTPTNDEPLSHLLIKDAKPQSVQQNLIRTPIQFKLMSISELLAFQDNEDNHLQNILEAMAKSLDEHATMKFENLLEQELAHALKHKRQNQGANCQLTQTEIATITQKIYKKFDESLKFFMSVDPRKGKESPLERMASPFKYLEQSKNPTFVNGCTSFASTLSILAFEQHRENPEQYVSHGFDHSINVANYTLDVLKMNPKIVVAMAKKYGISDGEARFFLENVALLHDAGYPCVGCRCKAVHGISGADLILPMEQMFHDVILSREADKINLFKDFRDAILFHSADKVESYFGVKIKTNIGTFLTEAKNVVKVLSHFYDPSKNPANTSRYAVEILAQNEEDRAEIQWEIDTAAAKFKEIYQNQPLGREYFETLFIPRVQIIDVDENNVFSKIFKDINTKFPGRFADLETNKDKLLGLEFSFADLLENPLNMIRLVDNMDMRNTRLTPIQNETAFREIYVRLGDHSIISLLSIALETLRGAIAKMPVDPSVPADENVKAAQLCHFTQAILDKHISGLSMDDPLEGTLKIDLLNKTGHLKTPEEARNFLNHALVDAIFKQDNWLGLLPEAKENIRFVGTQLSSYDFRHFGGTEAITNVQLVVNNDFDMEVPIIKVTVNRAKFEKLNEVKVSEADSDAKIGVGEYQIWRASDAYKSLRLGDTQIGLVVVDEKGAEVKCIINKS